MSNVSLIDGHIDKAEHCVCCGQVIPEGRQHCVICGYKAENEKQRQIDRIRNMSVEELAVFIATLLHNHLTAYTKAIGFEPPTLTATEITKANKEWGKWLESEIIV